MLYAYPKAGQGDKMLFCGPLSCANDMNQPALILPSEVYEGAPDLYDQAEIRQYNRHRFEMEHITAVVLNDPEHQVSVGYKDVSADEFWVRGNLPQRPFLPSVLLCEMAAQLCCFYVLKNQPMDTHLLAFAGLDEVEFGQPVEPGQRAYIVGRILRHRPGVMVSWQFQILVNQQIVCQGKLKGVPIPLDWLAARIADNPV